MASKRKKIFEMIDEHVEKEHAGEMIKDYISNLLEKNKELTKSLEKKKVKPKPRRPKSKHLRTGL